jgi:chromosome segregation ATPase
MVHRSALEYNNHTCSKRVPPVVDEIEALRQQLELNKREHIEMKAYNVQLECAVTTLRQRVADFEEEFQKQRETAGAMISHRDSLLAAYEKERDVLSVLCEERFNEIAASQHYAQQLREALERTTERLRQFGYIDGEAEHTLTLPRDTSALDAITKPLHFRIAELEAVIKSHGIPVKTYAGGEAHYCTNEYDDLNTELTRLSRIEDVALEVVASEVWSGDAFYDKLCKLRDVLGE